MPRPSSTQARQQGFKPKVITLGKALLFPARSKRSASSATACRPKCGGRPSHPFKSSLTGQSARQLADAYETAAKKQWTQPIGFAHALFEIAADAFKRTKDIDSSEAMRDAVAHDETRHRRRRVCLGRRAVQERRKTPLVGGPVAQDAAGSRIASISRS